MSQDTSRLPTIILVALLSFGMKSDMYFATCYGDTPCNACKNCKYCAHCAKQGGTCGVCRALRRSVVGILH
jgi:hypothetical protein